MARSTPLLSTFGSLLIFSFILTGCFGSRVNQSNASGDRPSSQIQPTLPAAVQGNVALVSNDEPPVIFKSNGEPIRQDNGLPGEVLYFEGFNEN